MRAMRINDFSMSPPKARAKRESLYEAPKGNDEYVMKTGRESDKAPAILDGKSPNGNNEH